MGQLLHHVLPCEGLIWEVCVAFDNNPSISWDDIRGLWTPKIPEMGAKEDGFTRDHARVEFGRLTIHSCRDRIALYINIPIKILC